MKILPHIAEYEKNSRQWLNWLSSSERHHRGFAISQEKRKLGEKIFCWMKSVAGVRKTKYRERRRVHWMFQLTAAAANLVRMAKWIPAQS